MTHDELRSSCAAHALGILDLDERSALEAHLAATRGGALIPITQP